MEKQIINSNVNLLEENIYNDKLYNFHKTGKTFLIKTIVNHIMNQ